MLKICLCLLVCGLLGATAAGAGDIDQTVATELDRINDLMIQATLDGDYAVVLDYYDPEVILSPNFQPDIYGRLALAEIYRESEKTGLKYHAFSTQVKDRWMEGTRVYERGTFGMSVSSKKDTQVAGFHGSYFQIWEKGDAGYRLKYVIWNLNHSPR